MKATDLTLDYVLPGDIILFHGTSIGSRLIQWGTSSFWNHAALVDYAVDEDIRLIESSGHGVHSSFLKQHGNEEIVVLRVKRATPELAEKVIRKAITLSVDAYDWELIKKLTYWQLVAKIGLLFGRKIQIPYKENDALQCAELVQEAWEAAGIWLLPEQVVPTPAALAASTAVHDVVGIIRK